MNKLIDMFSAQSLNSFVDYYTVGRKAEKAIIENKLNIDKKLKIALLASSTINGIKEVLVAQCSSLNLYAEFYLAEYGQYAQEIYNPKSDLYEVNPELIIINIDIRAIANEYFFLPYNLSISERKDWVIETLHFLSDLALKAAENTSAKIILHNLEVPDYSPLGILENKEEYGYVESIEDVNRQLRDIIKNYNQIFLYDYNAFCARVGKENILDFKMYYMGDLTIKPQNLPLLCEDYLRYISALTACTKKCIVLDLDNTLWGGVVGESGLEGIHLGPTPEGRPYLEFQKYLYALYSRGIVLAINSKNNKKDALEVLRNQPYMVLKEKHFAAMRINWDDKVSNMEYIAQEINIGLDSIVFIDDDQMNQNMIKQFLPEVFVVELPKDPSLYVNTLKNLNVFDSLILTEEDKNKGEMYHAEKKRETIKKTATDLNDYLRLLNIKVYVEKANKNNSLRIAQLTQKTNQFNMTTRRYTEESILEMSENASYRVIALRLTDKFGDYGLTGLAIIDSHQRNSWRIDTFLLSCRILGRSAENVLLAYIVQQAKKENINSVYGEFISTKKNMPANEFYKNNNFERIEVKNDLELWEYNSEDEYPFPEFIKCEVI